MKSNFGGFGSDNLGYIFEERPRKSGRERRVSMENPWVTIFRRLRPLGSASIASIHNISGLEIADCTLGVNNILEK